MIISHYEGDPFPVPLLPLQTKNELVIRTNEYRQSEGERNMFHLPSVFVDIGIGWLGGRDWHVHATSVFVVLPLIPEKAWTVPHHGFFCNDPDIRYPYLDSSLSRIVVGGVGYVGPIVTVCFSHLLAIHRKKKQDLEWNQIQRPLISIPGAWEQKLDLLEIAGTYLLPSSTKNKWVN